MHRWISAKFRALRKIAPPPLVLGDVFVCRKIHLTRLGRFLLVKIDSPEVLQVMELTREFVVVTLVTVTAPDHYHAVYIVVSLSIMLLHLTSR